MEVPNKRWLPGNGGGQFLSGRILAGLLLPEPKTSLKCSIAALVSGNKLRSLEKNHFRNPFSLRAIIYKKKVPFFYFLLQKSTSIFFLELLERSPKTLRPSFFGPHPLANGEGGSPSSPPLTPAPHSLYWMTQQTGYSEDPYSRPSPRLPLHHFSQRRMLASLLRREARRSQGDLEALARGQRFFSLHQFTLCCCMLFTTLRCQPPPHSHLERPIINPILLE